jgi:hypothetical protein
MMSFLLHTRVSRVAGYDAEGRGLPLAEQSARRYWRGVEGGTVLSHHSSSLKEKIGDHIAKEKLIIFVTGSKNNNRLRASRESV